MPLNAKRLAQAAFSNALRVAMIISKAVASTRQGSKGNLPKGLSRTGSEGSNMAPPLVETVTVNEEGAPFATGTLAGTWHVAPSGAPLHVNETLPL